MSYKNFKSFKSVKNGTAFIDNDSLFVKLTSETALWISNHIGGFKIEKFDNEDIIPVDLKVKQINRFNICSTTEISTFQGNAFICSPNDVVYACISKCEDAYIAVNLDTGKIVCIPITEDYSECSIVFEESREFELI